MVASSARRFHLALLAALLVVFVSAVPIYAKCDPTTDPDKTDIANARAAILANCDCAGSTNHGDYVKCAVQQANLTLQNQSCKGAVKKCAAHSTCGKPTAVTCCLTTTKGTKCKIKKDAAHCTAKQGTVGSCTSCCDACPAPGSGPSCPTPTTTTTTTPPVACCQSQLSGSFGCTEGMPTQGFQDGCVTANTRLSQYGGSATYYSNEVCDGGTGLCANSGDGVSYCCSAVDSGQNYCFESPDAPSFCGFLAGSSYQGERCNGNAGTCY
jgi:hypothetical protein